MRRIIWQKMQGINQIRKGKRLTKSKNDMYVTYKVKACESIQNGVGENESSGRKHRAGKTKDPLPVTVKTASGGERENTLIRQTCGAEGH